MPTPLTGKLTSFDNRGMRSNDTLGTSSQKQDHRERAAARRAIKPGFPILTPFTSADEIRSYFSGDTILCLRCGKEFRSISWGHLILHDMTPDEYREFYNLPYRRGLTCADAHNNRSEFGKRPEQLEHLQKLRDGGALDAMRARNAANPYRKSAAKSLLTKDNLATAPNYKLLPDEAFDRCIDAMIAEDKNLREICQQHRGSFPSITRMHQKMQKDAVLRERYLKAKNGLSFDAKLRAQRLDEEFVERAKKLRAEGMGYSAIGRKLGVGAMTVHRHLNPERY